MKKFVDVQIGQVKVSQGNAILQSKALGSCIAIVAYDPKRKVGSLTHIMLPGRAPIDKKPGEKTKYAANAIEAIIAKMSKKGSKREDLKMILVGAGNVLNRADDTICRDNIESTLQILRRKGLKVRAQALGGIDRKGVALDVDRGIVSYSKGNGAERELYNCQAIQSNRRDK